MKMSILITGGLIVLAILFLVVNLIYITLALYSLGISGLFKTIEEVFEGKNDGGTAEDYLVYAGVISASIFVVFFILLIIGIIVTVFFAPEEAAGAVAVGGAEAAEIGVTEAGAAEAGAGAAGESGLADVLPRITKVGRLISGTFGTMLLIILFIIMFVSTASGIFCFLAAAEIKKNPKFDGKKDLRDAYTYSIIAGITGISIVVLSIMGVIGSFVIRHTVAKKKSTAKTIKRRIAIKGATKLLEDIA